MSNLRERQKEGSVALTKKSCKKGRNMGGRSWAMEAMALSTTYWISRRFRLIRTKDLPGGVRVYVCGKDTDVDTHRRERVVLNLHDLRSFPFSLPPLSSHNICLLTPSTHQAVPLCHLIVCHSNNEGNRQLRLLHSSGF